LDFVRKCRETGVNTPIIPGLKSWSTKGQLNTLPQNIHGSMPDELVRMAENTKPEDDANEADIIWSIQQG
tara:strand:+ start:406 stop:615 length:210 start_codon:yes stop_codon:yes gene_type:complete